MTNEERAAELAQHVIDQADELVKLDIDRFVFPSEYGPGHIDYARHMEERFAQDAAAKGLAVISRTPTLYRIQRWIAADGSSEPNTTPFSSTPPDVEHVLALDIVQIRIEGIGVPMLIKERL